MSRCTGRGRSSAIAANSKKTDLSTLSASPIRFEEITRDKLRVIPNIPGVTAGYLVFENRVWRFEPGINLNWCSLRTTQMQQITDKMKELEGSRKNDTTPLTEEQQFEVHNTENLYVLGMERPALKQVTP